MPPDTKYPALCNNNPASRASASALHPSPQQWASGLGDEGDSFPLPLPLPLSFLSLSSLCPIYNLEVLMQ